MPDNSNTGGGWGSLLGPALSTAANVYGSQNAAEAQTKGNNAGIITQQNTLGNINSLYGPQSSLGNGAFDALGRTLGLNGAPPDYSGFLNMPGYQFAVQQGTQAINRNAAAAGNAYSSSTLADVGKQVTGTAMQDYNNYISQLINAGGFGASANQNLSGAQLRVGGNISQLQVGTGSAQAGGYTGAAGALGQLPWNQIGTGIGNLFGGTGTGSPNSSGVSPGSVNTGSSSFDPSTGLPYNTPSYTPTTDPVTGQPIDNSGTGGPF